MKNEENLQKEHTKPEQTESNAERDQDHGNMNNGTIGGNMGIIGGSKEGENEQPLHQADEGGGSTARRDADGGANNT
jgi:hypothetical protein